MLADKLKDLIPIMEKFIKMTEEDHKERGFTFGTNKEAKIEEIFDIGDES